MTDDTLRAARWQRTRDGWRLVLRAADGGQTVARIERTAVGAYAYRVGSGQWTPARSRYAAQRAARRELREQQRGET